MLREGWLAMMTVQDFVYPTVMKLRRSMVMPTGSYSGNDGCCVGCDCVSRWLVACNQSPSSSLRDRLGIRRQRRQLLTRGCNNEREILQCQPPTNCQILRSHELSLHGDGNLRIRQIGAVLYIAL